MKRLMKSKEGIEIEVLVWWIVAAVILIVMVVAFIILKNKEISMIELIKNLFRFKQ